MNIIGETIMGETIIIITSFQYYCTTGRIAFRLYNVIIKKQNMHMFLYMYEYKYMDNT